MIELEPVATSLSNRVGQYLTSIRMKRDDTAALDSLALHHIVENTYLPFQRIVDASNSNFIVPKAVVEEKSNYSTWRYAPHIAIDFLIEDKINVLKVKVEFSVSTWVNYGKVENGKIKRFVTLKGERPPNRFFELKNPESNKENSDSYSILEDEKYVSIKSYSAIHFSWEKELSLEAIKGTYQETLTTPPVKRVFKSYDSSSQEIRNDGDYKEGYDVLYETSESVNLLVKIRLSNSADSDSKYRVYVEVVNVTPKSGSVLQGKNNWKMKCVLFPILSLKFDTSQIFPTLDESSQFGADISEAEREETLESIRHYAPRGVNAIPFYTSGQTNELIAGMCSVHDSPYIEPKEGPLLSSLLNLRGLEECLVELTPEEVGGLKTTGQLEVLRSVLATISLTYPEVTALHKFQWKAIQERLKLLLNRSYHGSCQLVKAPTGSGKTLVFLADALLHFMWTKERVAIAFPTRILNEDMYKRLTILIHNARIVFPSENITGGIFIGMKDPLYQSISMPDVGDLMVQYDTCPECKMTGTVYAETHGNRIIGVCRNKECSHKIDYMYGSRETADYLPSITIATPDKLFFEATARKGPEPYPMRLFGGKFRKCINCGAANPLASKDFKPCIKCHSTNLGEIERNPMMFWIFDEVHSLYGLTGTYLSIFLASLQNYWKRIKSQGNNELDSKLVFSFEVGTATVSNEQQLIREMFRVETDKKIIVTPTNSDFPSYFEMDLNKTRYRTLVTIPIAEKATRLASSDMLVTRKMLFDSSQFQNHIARELKLAPSTHYYNMSLVYVQRKEVGKTLVRDYEYKTKQEYDEAEAIPFISGDTPTDDLVEYFNRVNKGLLRNLIANVVISLGVDIKELNHMTVVSVPESITEFVQTIGRTGRTKAVPGFVHVILRPDYPRDVEFYEDFNFMLSDIRGYYDTKPIKRSSIYAARRIFPNVLRLTLVAFADGGQYMLTTNTALKKLDNSPAILLSVLKDIAASLVGAENPQFMEYLKLAKDELDGNLRTWRKLVGGVHYLGSVLSSEQQLLPTLRGSEEREVPIEGTDMLTNELELQRHGALGFKDENFEKTDEEE